MAFLTPSSALCGVPGVVMLLVLALSCSSAASAVSAGATAAEQLLRSLPSPPDDALVSASAVSARLQLQIKPSRLQILVTNCSSSFKS